MTQAFRIAAPFAAAAVLTTAAFAATGVAAQQPRVTQADVDPPPQIVLDCADAPEAAVTEIPGPASEFAQVHCTAFGHFVSPAEGWLWALPGGGLFFRAGAGPLDDLPKELGHTAHFTELSSERLSPEEVARRKAGNAALPAGAENGVIALQLASSLGWTGELLLVGPTRDEPYWLTLDAEGRRVTAAALRLDATGSED